jgi:hypothetical protein
MTQAKSNSSAPRQWPLHAQTTESTSFDHAMPDIGAAKSRESRLLVRRGFTRRSAVADHAEYMQSLVEPRQLLGLTWHGTPQYLGKNFSEA